MFARFRSLPIFALALLAGAVSAQQSAKKASGLPDGVQVERGLTYATAPEQPLQLDLYTPVETPAQGLPLVVWIHGGGWQGGNRDNNPAAYLVQHGYVSASITYRLSGVAKFPAQIYDCKAAIRWLRANAPKYHIDPARVGVWGSSAGGHLAALMGTSGGSAPLEGRLGVAAQSSRVQAVVDFFGPTDFLRMNDFPGQIDHNKADSPESQLLGGAIQERPDAVQRANPTQYATSDDPPFLIVHGDKDPLVPIDQSERLQQALVAVGVESTLYRVAGGGHGQRGEFGSEKLREMVRTFFDRHLKAAASAEKQVP